MAGRSRSSSTSCLGMGGLEASGAVQLTASANSEGFQAASVAALASWSKVVADSLSAQAMDFHENPEVSRPCSEFLRG